jgi:hypothetical protein
VKVSVDRIRGRLPWRASVAALASALVALLGLFPTTAHAITRDAVLGRAHDWVVKRVRYSQSSTFAGYRRDCSGFVSMAWKLGRSYTSSTIRAVAVRVPLSKLRPGDAVHTSGHVAIFVRWANAARSRYVAMEESQPGRPAMHHVRSIGRSATGLRYRRIAEDPIVVAVAPAPQPPLTGVSAAVASAWTAAAGMVASGSVPATATAGPL